MALRMKQLQILAICIASAMAAPAPQNVFAPTYCQTKYEIDTQGEEAGGQITGDYTVSGGKLPRTECLSLILTSRLGSELTQGSTFETSVTIETGVEISVSDVARVGLSVSVATTTTKSTGQSATVPCPEGPWKCALAIYPEMLKVTGNEVAANDYCKDRDDDDELPNPYTVYYPVENETGGIRARVEICACTNFDHADDEGAPEIKCGDCAL